MSLAQEAVDTATAATEEPDHIEKLAAYPGEDVSFTSQRELNGW
jgi:hypothetical protein